MRIHPIRAGTDVRCHDLIHLSRGIGDGCFCRNAIDHEVFEPSPCAPVNVVRESPEARAFAVLLRTGDILRPPVSAIPTILLRLAIAGLLPRMKVFDWQVLHGEWLATKEDLGENLDIAI